MTGGLFWKAGGQGLEPRLYDPPRTSMEYSRRCVYKQVFRPGQTPGTDNKGRGGTKMVGFEGGFPSERWRAQPPAAAENWLDREIGVEWLR